jgi:hypothetical protein
MIDFNLRLISTKELKDNEIEEKETDLKRTDLEIESTKKGAAEYTSYT